MSKIKVIDKKIFIGPTAKKGYSAALDHGVYGGTNFIISILLARLISPEEFGAFVLIFAILLFAKGIQTALITEPMVIIGAPKKRNNLKNYVSSTAISQVILGILLTIILYFSYQVLIFLGIGYHYTNALRGLTLIIFFILLQDFFRRLLFMRTKSNQVLINDTFYSIIQLSGIYFLYYNKLLSEYTAFLAIGIGAFLASIFGFFQCKKYFILRIFQFKKILQENWNYGKWALGTITSNWTSAQAYFFISAFFLGPIAPAVLKACQNVLSPLHIVQMAVDNIFPPIASKKFTKSGKDELNKFLINFGIILIIIVLIYGLFVSLNAEKILFLLYKGEYIGYKNIVIVFTMANIFSTINRPFLIGLRAIRKPKEIFFSVIISTIIALIIAPHLILNLFILGAAIGIMLRELLSLILVSFRYLKG